MPDSGRAQYAVRLPMAIVVSNMGILFIIHIAEVIVGAIYYSDCPRQPLIPVYLVVMGVIPLLWCCVRCNTVLSYLVSIFLCCWFIAGNVRIYSIYEPKYNKNATLSSYCNKTLYMFAFWTNNLTCVLLFGILFSLCCCRQQEHDDNDAQRPLQG